MKFERSSFDGSKEPGLEIVHKPNRTIRKLFPDIRIFLQDRDIIADALLKAIKHS